MKDNKSGWQFPKALEIIKCKEGNKEFMKERPARRPFGNTVLICEYPIDDTAAEEPNAKLITWRLAKRAARDFLRVSFMPTVNIKSHERSYSIMFSEKKTECRVCGYRFTPERENIYTAEEPRSMADMLTKPPTRFSAVDCPICGCQIALAIRVPRVDISDNAERHDADALNIPASPYPDGDKGVLACPNCGSGEYLHNADENENAFCGQCGQAIKWGCEDED